MTSMNALQLLLELRSLQQMAAQQDEYQRQRFLSMNTMLPPVLHPTEVGSLNRTVPFHAQSLAESVQIRSSPSASNFASRNDKFTTSAHSLLLLSTKKTPALPNKSTLIASYAPIRAKRGADRKQKAFLTTETSDNCTEIKNEVKAICVRPCDKVLNSSSSSKKNSKWSELYNTLKNLRDCNGHCVVPRHSHDAALGCWVIQQRRQFRLFQNGISSSINQERIDLLNEIGFTWDAQEASWDRQMDELRNYKNKYGTCDVSRSDKGYCKLYRWVREQRRIYRDKNKNELPGGLSTKRINDLRCIGFDFDSVSSSFAIRLEEMTEFRRQHNHCHVPRENFNLYVWVQHIRQECQMMLNGKGCYLRDWHIQALNAIDFPWTTREYDLVRNEQDDETRCLFDSSSPASPETSARAASLLSQDQNQTVLDDRRPFKKRRIS